MPVSFIQHRITTQTNQIINKTKISVNKYNTQTDIQTFYQTLKQTNNQINQTNLNHTNSLFKPLKQKKLRLFSSYMLLLLLSFCFNQYDAQPSSTHREFVTSITSFDEDFKSTTSTKEVELISSTSSLQEVPILPDKCTILSLTSLQEVAKPIVKKKIVK